MQKPWKNSTTQNPVVQATLDRLPEGSRPVDTAGSSRSCKLRAAAAEANASGRVKWAGACLHPML